MAAAAFAACFPARTVTTPRWRRPSPSTRLHRWGRAKAALGGLAATIGLERPGTIRALAGRPTLYFQPAPCVLAVAQAQGRNQGY
jgi:hypothetical protein